MRLTKQALSSPLFIFFNLFCFNLIVSLLCLGHLLTILRTFLFFILFIPKSPITIYQLWRFKYLELAQMLEIISNVDIICGILLNKNFVSDVRKTIYS